jgi:nodulation protein E
VNGDRRRVYVTGAGVVSACGIGMEPFWQTIRENRSGIGPLSFDRPARNTVLIGGAVREFNPTGTIAPSVLPFCDRFAQFALVAAQEAVEQAGFAPDARLGDRTAVIIGTGVGGATTIETGIHRLYVTQERVDPWSVPRLMPNAAASQVSARFGARGPSFAVSSACSSASQAIGIGAQMVRAGMVDRALVGGAEACLTATGLRSWEALRVLSPTACRPFSKNRDGIVLGEGAGVFVIESEAVMAARGARPIAELLGYGTTSDAGDIVRPDVGGASGAMLEALADAGLQPDAIDYVNAHGTGTNVNDMTESAALQAVFGERLASLPVSSTKPAHGHALGAAGALELAVTIAALRDGIAPATLNHEVPDPRCPIDCVPNTARSVPMRIAMSNSFAFGGINAALILGKV